MRDSDTPSYGGGSINGAWAGPPLTGACPVCPQEMMGGSHYAFPDELEASARAIHAPAHPRADYVEEWERLTKFITDMRGAFDDMLLDLYARERRLLLWSETEGVTDDGPE